MYSNEQVKAVCRELMKEMEGYINLMESEMALESPNLSKISSALGKLSKVYCMVGNFTGLFSGVDFREGGYKDVTQFMPTSPEEVESDN